MVLRYGLVALGIYVAATGLLHRSMPEVFLGVIVVIVAASLFQAHRVAKRWRDEADRLETKVRK